MKHFLHIVTISLLLFSFAVPANATFTLKHRMGVVELPAGEGQDALFLKSGQQVVHTDSVIIYSTSTANVTCARPDKKPFTTYVRWYNYDTDSVVSDGLLTDANNTYHFDIRNPRGWFKTNMTGTQNWEVKYKNTIQKVIRIAADLSAYGNYEWTVDGEDTTVIEPTLSKRLIYIFRPASEIAARVDTCKNNDSYLEVHEMIAPTGRQLYIGPDYPIFTKGSAYCNYHFKASNPTQMNPSGNADATKWKWTVVGGESVYLNTKNTPDANTIINGQYKSASSGVAGVVTYTLQYEQSATEIYNIAKFHVTYVNASEIGPSTSVSSPEPTSKMELLYEQNFNFNRPGTTALTYYIDKHIPVEESSYGCYYPDIAFIGGSSPTQRPNTRSDLTSGEYGICNMQDIYSQSKCIYNHVENHVNTKDDAKEGYFLYVDGSDKQGEVFSLEVNADLCPGSTMYFYAWLIDGSTKDRSAPNMDFIVIGEDEDGTEHILTTYTTGEFGWNALEDVSGSTKMQLATWYQVMFPVYIDQYHIYPRYELKILNKGRTNDGNDFAIDDIRVYAQRPPVMPLQASTSECVDQASATITAYLRVDYQEIEYDGESLFFQWRDENNNILPAEYYNIDSTDNKSTVFGRVPVKQESELTDADKCASLLDFDSQFRNTETTVIRYIPEKINLTTTRYVMYIAMPIEVRPNHTYTGFVSPLLSHLGSRNEQSCGTFADLYVSGGTRITINDEITTEETVHVCGHRTYDLNIVLTQVVQDYSTENLKVDTFRCKADWLVGGPEYVNAHPEIYLNTFDEIQANLDFYHQNPDLPVAKAPIEYLMREGLLFLDTFGISMTPELSLSYTAFPRGQVILPGSTEPTNVCSVPRFLHIQPADPASNMMMVGKDASEYVDLPDVVKNRPRIIRISDAQRREGWFSVPLYRIGAEESYIIDRVYTISSTDPNWRSVALISDHDEMHVKDTIHLGAKGNVNDPVNTAIQSLKPGYDYTFHVAFVGESDEDRCDRGHTYFTLRIVPDSVTWVGGDWNRDASWNYFVPLDTTNVILKPDTNYTITLAADPAESFDFNYTHNKCRNIYIPANTSMAGQEKVVINGKAYIDLPVPAQKWALTSMPIKGIVSGDLFVSQNESTDPFTVAHIVHGETDETAIDRVTYEVYDSPFDATTNTWTRPDSILDRPIRPTDAVMIGIDCASGSADPVIRLPKPDNYYRFYDFNTNLWRTEDKTISEGLRAQLGKPAWDGNTSVTIARANNDKLYMFGNPTFGYIDLTQVVADNDKLTGRYYMTPADGATEITIDLATINPSAAHVLLPPCRGVLLEGNGDETITITDLHVVTPSSTPSTPAPKRRMQTSSTFDAKGGVPIGAIGSPIVPGTVLELDEWSMTLDEELDPWVGQDVPTVRMVRELYRDGAYNTICLPFSMTAEQIDASPLTGAEIYEFTSAEKTSDLQLEIEVSPTNHIDAGVPYLIKWDPATPEVIPMPLVFNDVHIETNDGQTIGNSNEVQFVGSVPRKLMVYEDKNNLFVGAANTLYWPNTHNPLRGFRAYFQVPTTGAAAVPKNTNARIVVRTNVTTGIAPMTNDQRPMTQKLIIDGQVYVLRNGKLYTILGQTVE